MRCVPRRLCPWMRGDSMSIECAQGHARPRVHWSTPAHDFETFLLYYFYIIRFLILYLYK